MQQTIFEDWTITSKGSAAPRRVNRKEHSLIFSLTAAKIILLELETHVVWQRDICLIQRKLIIFLAERNKERGGWFLKLLRLSDCDCEPLLCVCVCVWKIQWQKISAVLGFREREEMMAEASYLRLTDSLQWHERRPPLWDTIFRVVRNGIQIKWLQFLHVLIFQNVFPFFHLPVPNTAMNCQPH